ncbi:hypothetical protein BKA64DRAFT_252342 [Cadophora sp. MPI-SDFR-AT-0126]|nr:hypothetical protein BKA64DRAFT_252342 [Leotiomycetes sp. MPI-SDFR-AT-0126]
MYSSQQLGRSARGPQTRTLSSRRQNNALNSTQPMPPRNPPSYTFRINDGPRRANENIPTMFGNILRQEADSTQTRSFEGMSMDTRLMVGYSHPGPPPTRMGRSSPPGSHFSPPSQRSPSFAYAGHSLSPPALGPSSHGRTSSAPNYNQASLSPFSGYAFPDENCNEGNSYLSPPTGPYYQHPTASSSSSTTRDHMNGQGPYLPSPAPTYPVQTPFEPDHVRSPFGNTDRATRGMLFSYDTTAKQPSNTPQVLLFPDALAATPSAAVPQPDPQPFSARSPTPPPGYMFGSPADLQAAVNSDPQRVYSYIRRLNRENVSLQERLGRSRQQTKDEEDRDKRHVTAMERAWDNLSAALVQVNPALAGNAGPAVQQSVGGQANDQATKLGRTNLNTRGGISSGRGRGAIRGRGTTRVRGTGRAGGRQRGVDGRGQGAAPNVPARANTRKGKGVSKTQPVDGDETESETEEDGDL